MSGLRSTLIAGLAATAISAQAEGSQEVTPRTSSPAVTAATQAATQTLMADVVQQPVLVAQAQERDGKEYFADIPQVDGTGKVIRIKYYRDKQGVIIPPPVENGKLIDGSPAPEHPLRALIAQKKILVPYDKNAQNALAMIGDKDLVKDALGFSKTFREYVDSWKPITKEQLESLLFHSYIIIESGRDFSEPIKTARIIATWSLKMTSSQFEEIRSSAEKKAKQIWKATTGALA